MRARQTPPDGFVLADAINIDTDARVKRTILVAGVLWTVPCVALICGLAGALRPLEMEFNGNTVGGQVSLVVLLVSIGLSGVVAMVVHELVHGALLWWLTRARPVFGFKGWYAYAGAPGWYFGRAPWVPGGVVRRAEC
jgi:hypothetical protein